MEAQYQTKDYKVRFVINPNPSGQSTRIDNSEKAQAHRLALETFDERAIAKQADNYWGDE